MENEEQPQKSKLQRHAGSAQGVFYSGYATSLMDDLGEVVIVASSMSELIQRWYSITDAILDIEKVQAVAIFSESAVKPNDSGNAVAVELMSKD